MSSDTVQSIVFVALIALVLLVPFYWHRIPALATFWRRTGGRLDDGELGLAAFQLPHGWKGASHAGSGAGIQATDRLGRRFVAVFSDARQDFTSEMDLQRFHAWMLKRLAATTRVLEIHGPEPCTVGPFDALQTETLTLIEPHMMLRSLRTVVAGDRGFHQIISWTTPSAYDRELFLRLRDGFHERPGPTPPVRSSVEITPSSRYDVH